MEWGSRQQGLPIQGRTSSGELLEWTLDPGSKLGHIWDFLWTLPLLPFCPPPLISISSEDLSYLNLFLALTFMSLLQRAA